MSVAQVSEFVRPDNSVWIAEQIFPARVADPRLSAARDEVKVTLLSLDHIGPDKYALVVAGDTREGPAVLSADVVTLKDTTSASHTVVLEDGSEISYGKGGGCGCGSRLRGYMIFDCRLIGIPMPRVSA